jgi:hypothetical protein
MAIKEMPEPAFLSRGMASAERRKKARFAEGETAQASRTQLAAKLILTQEIRSISAEGAPISIDKLWVWNS